MYNHNYSIKTLYDYCRNEHPVKNIGILDLTTNQYQDVDRNFNWIDLVPTIDEYIYHNYGYRILRDYSPPVKMMDIVMLQNEIQNMLLTNEYKYKTLYVTTTFEYNPIENYSSIEERYHYGEDTGSNTLTTGAGKTTVINDIGETVSTTTESSSEHIATDKVDYGQHRETQTDDIAKQKETVISNNGTTEQVHSVSPSDETVFYGKDKTVTDQTKDGEMTTTRDAHTDNHTINIEPKSDTTTTTIKPYEDTTTNRLNNRQDVNTTTTDTKEDINRRDLQTEFYEKNTKSGNVGVTTSQQMLMSEREVANFSLISIIAHDIVNQITKNLIQSF